MLQKSETPKTALVHQRPAKESSESRKPQKPKEGRLGLGPLGICRRSSGSGVEKRLPSSNQPLALLVLRRSKYVGFMTEGSRFHLLPIVSSHGVSVRRFLLFRMLRIAATSAGSYSLEPGLRSDYLLWGCNECGNERPDVLAASSLRQHDKLSWLAMYY